MTTGAWTRTTCPYCGVGCGILARPDHGGETASIKGDPEHPANFGRLCSKGSALGETLALDDRLLYPTIDGKRAGWDTALDLVADRFREAVATHGPDSVALYVSGQILTEDYYVANKLMKGFVGSANIDTNSRLCMASSVAGHKRAFGSDTVPGVYEDLDQADLVVLVGSNLAWCHPVLYQRLMAAREQRGTRIVVIDPRRTATCDSADLHLPIASGTDVALFNGLLSHLADADAFDRDYIDRHTSGLGETLKAAQEMGFDAIVATTGLDADDIRRFYAMFTATERVVTVYSQGVNQSSAGTDKVNAIINCHLATGRIGRPGMGPFSVTGQPNAMGGRETGGLANMLAAHMELGDANHRRIVQDFWQSPAIASAPGLKAVDLFDAVANGRIKALWIMATNPVDSLPDADRVRSAIAACPFVVVSDVARETDTTALAHVLLPAAAWGEKDGTVTNSERRISRQRAFLPLPGEARPDWWQLAEVAKRMGFAERFAWRDPSEIFAEYAALTGAENGGTRDLDISSHAGIAQADYDHLVPFQWPQPAGTAPQQSRFFADGRFFTPDRRARFVPTPHRAPKQATSPTHPLVLNTGRLRDQWHTMTRTSKAARLMAHAPEPVLDIHPADAASSGVRDGNLARVSSARGAVVMRISVTEAQQPGSVFAPIHWTDRIASRARIDTLVAAVTDPVSGQPESKHTPVVVAPLEVEWHGFAVTTTALRPQDYTYAAIARIPNGYRVEIAGDTEPEDFDALAQDILRPASDAPIDMLAYYDCAAGQRRYAAFVDERLAGLLFLAREPLSMARGWAAGQLGGKLTSADRLKLLAGRPGGETRDKGRIVCACLEVGTAEITHAVLAGCRSVAEVANATRAGTNCGSCRAEIGRLIDATRIQKTG